MIVFSIVCLVIIDAPSRSQAANCTHHYAAKPNDSWTRLAVRFGIPLSELLTLNRANASTALLVGDRVCLSTGPQGFASPKKFTRKQSRAIIREVWPDKLEQIALIVAKRESNLDHAVVGGKNKCCIGLFQIYWSVHQSWLSHAGVTSAEQLLDPRINAESALALYRRSGNSWRPWWTSTWRP